MNLLVSLLFPIIFCLVFGLLFKKLKTSSVAGMMVAGLIAGSPIISGALIEPNTDIVLEIGYFGLLSMMFIAGMEVSWSMLSKEKKDAAILGIFASLTPLLLGFFVFLFLGFSVEVAFFVGICMSITAEATKAKVLMEMRKVKTKIGSLLLGVGIIDDIIGLALFVTLGYMFTVNMAVREAMIISGALWSFFLGIFIHREIGRHEKMMPKVEKFLMYVISPFFFVSMGIHFSAQSLIIEPLLLIIVIVLAITGKMMGTWLTGPFTKLRPSQLYLIGWGMNSRGAVELALVLIAFNVGIIPVNVYSALIIMTVVTTLAFPVFMAHAIRAHPKIMD